MSLQEKTARLMFPFGLGSAHHSQATAPLKDKRLFLEVNEVPPSVRALQADGQQQPQSPSPLESSPFPIPHTVPLRSGSNPLGLHPPEDLRADTKVCRTCTALLHEQ